MYSRVHFFMLLLSLHSSERWQHRYWKTCIDMVPPGAPPGYMYMDTVLKSPQSYLGTSHSFSGTIQGSDHTSLWGLVPGWWHPFAKQYLLPAFMLGTYRHFFTSVTLLWCCRICLLAYYKHTNSKSNSWTEQHQCPSCQIFHKTDRT